MTAPDSRDSVERIVAEMREAPTMSQFVDAADLASALMRERVEIADRLSALAVPQQAGGEDGDFLDDVCWQSWRDRAYKAEAEVTEIACALPGVRFMDQPDGGSPTVAEQVRRMAEALEAAEAALREAQEDARQLAASVHGAFKALNSRPPEPILKLANRYFLMKRRGRRSAALNGGQDDA